MQVDILPTSTGKTSRPGLTIKGEARAKVAEGIGQRAQADELIGGWWVYLPLLAVAFGLVGLIAFVLILPGVSGWIFGYVVMYTAALAMLSILNYKQTRRLAEHVRREAMVRAGLIQYLRAVSEEKGEPGRAASDLSTMAGLDAEASAQERLPSAMYAAMSVLPLVGLVFECYYLFHLNRVPAPHDQRWAAFMQRSTSANSALGLGAVSAAPTTMRGRSFPLLLLASLVFLPFLAYWYHVMIKETNEHFMAQWKVEDQLLSAIK